MKEKNVSRIDRRQFGREKKTSKKKKSWLRYLKKRYPFITIDT